MKLFSHLPCLGSSFIGGLYICLTGPITTANDSAYVVQELNYCVPLSSNNETLANNLEINFALSKVINRTELLRYSDSANYSGIWIPTMTNGPLDDGLRYRQQGAFLRYLSTANTITITFSETQFYMINKQEPIARMNEILFHNVLFTTTIIGLFALAFLLFKLTFMPLIQWISKRELCLSRFCKGRKETPNDGDSVF